MYQDFVLGISVHRIFGIQLKVLLLGKKDKSGFSFEIINQADTLSYLPDFWLSIFKLIKEYSENELFLPYKRKYNSLKDFLSKIDKEKIQNNIRPVIEKRIVKILDLAIRYDIPVYEIKEKSNLLFNEDKRYIFKGLADSVFYFNRDEEGTKYHQKLKLDGKEISLINKKFLILSNNPAWIMMENRILKFSNIDAKKLLPFTQKENIYVPQRVEPKFYSGFVKNCIKKFDVVEKGFELKEYRDNPVPVLKLEKDLFSKACFSLSFRYSEDLLIGYNSTASNHVIDNSNSGGFSFLKYCRQFDFENDIIAYCNKLDLVTSSDHYFRIYSNTDLTTEDYADWLIKNKSLLSERNIDLIFDNEYEKLSLDVIEHSIELNEEIDWFDIKVVITIGEFVFNIIDFRKNILEKNRYFVLPNGKIAYLPIAWFHKFPELVKYGIAKGDKISLKNHYFSLLKELGISSRRYTKYVSQSDTSKEIPPANFKAELRSYQLDGFRWMKQLHNYGFGACLADDMGLGKTIQTLCLLCSIPQRKTILKSDQPIQLSLFDDVTNLEVKIPSLLVMPVSLLQNWQEEIRRFAPKIRFLIFAGSDRPKKGLQKKFEKYDLILTTYGIVRNDISLLSKVEFNYVILDESQNIKNPSSKINIAVCQLKSKSRLVLTGTPIENSLFDLWAQMNFINPGLLGDYRDFRVRYMDVPENYSRLRTIVEPFVLRRTKSEVAKELPEKTEQILYCSMDEEQESIYEKEKNQMRNSIIDAISENRLSREGAKILSAMTKLRQIANHPKMIFDDYTGQSTKFKAVTSVLKNLMAENHKVLIFSSFTKHLEIYKQYFINNEMMFSSLTGEMNTRKRRENIENFQNNDSNHFFLISLKAGGFGLNLTKADYVIMLDPWWNPTAENQATDRAHRIGQDKPVFVYRFITKDTLEEKMLKLQTKKKKLSEDIISENQQLKKYKLTELKDLFD